VVESKVIDLGFRKIANKVLTAVFILFIVAAWLKYYYPGNTAVILIYVCLEAALIGGIADWFAVTALFDRPLGIRWHTELIPRNRERIAEALTEAVENDLLSVEAIRKRIADIAFVEFFIRWVDQQGGKDIIAEIFVRHGRLAWEKRNHNDFVFFLEDLIKRNVSEFDLAPQFSTFIKQAMAQGKGEKLVDFILEELILLVEKPSFRQSVYHYMNELKQKKARSLLEKAVVWLGEQTDGINIEEAAEALCDELLALLKDLANHDHLVRAWISEKLHGVLVNIENEPVWQEAVESWKVALVEQIKLTEPLAVVVSKTANGSFEAATEWLAAQANIYWTVFKENKALQIWFEAKIKYSVYRLIKKEHYLIGRIVKSVLGSFSNSDLSKFVEVKAGNDLQWIRVNGSIVGGIVGLIIYAFLHGLYEPYVVPVIRSWLG
jgi:uncharacterized membrane-anchored protein YjiN (DUF445 family)